MLLSAVILQGATKMTSIITQSKAKYKSLFHKKRFYCPPRKIKYITSIYNMYNVVLSKPNCSIDYAYLWKMILFDLL